jgi:hypothetical protein
MESYYPCHGKAPVLDHARKAIFVDKRLNYSPAGATLAYREEAGLAIGGKGVTGKRKAIARRPCPFTGVPAKVMDG